MSKARITLNRGDLLMWDPGPRSALGPGPLLVADEHELWYQFSNKPWHEMEQRVEPNGPLVRGLTVEQAEAVLNGEAEWTLPGRLWKCYDRATMTDLPPRGCA